MRTSWVEIELEQVGFTNDNAHAMMFSRFPV